MRFLVAFASAAVLSVDPTVADVIGCGYVIEVPCPGCVASTPGGCGCAPNSARPGHCDCLAAPGQVQNDPKITCFDGDWDYLPSATNYPQVTDSEEFVLCQRVEGCFSGSSHINCAVFDDGDCLNITQCEWKLIEGGETTRMIYKNVLVQCGGPV